MTKEKKRPWGDVFSPDEDFPWEIVYLYNEAASVTALRGEPSVASYEICSDFESFAFEGYRNPMAFLMAEVMGDNEWAIDDWVTEEEEDD
jgi:hypothetical protein